MAGPSIGIAAEPDLQSSVKGSRRVSPQGEPLAALYDSLFSREMPETVAARLAEIGELAGDARIAGLLAQRTHARRTFSSMPQGWFVPVDLRKKIRVAQSLFETVIQGANDPRAAISPEENDPKRIFEFIQYLAECIHKSPHRDSFLHSRLNREGRAYAGLEYGNHAYNKRFRLLNRMAEHLKQYRKETRFAGYRIAGKVGLVADVTYEDFCRDIWSAAFVSYFIARKRRRSVFTNTAQDRPFDDLCAALLRRCEKTDGANWELIARVYPEAEVLARLDDTARGRLLGYWLMLLRDLAEDLAGIWQRTSIDLDTMIVQRGNDSSSWNIAAQAWNSARTGWLAFNRAMGTDNLTEKFLPGKVLRLMGADVAAWHRMSGGAVHPDTLVWRELPAPWEVMRGRAACNRALIDAVCERAGLDPVKSGWSAPVVSRQAARYRPTPELVHGVEVASPELAALLRRLGWFSWKA
jgi:hypothetical protein